MEKYTPPGEEAEQLKDEVAEKFSVDLNDPKEVPKRIAELKTSGLLKQATELAKLSAEYARIKSKNV